MTTTAVMRTLVGAASKAPSIHNTQPWTFSSEDDDLLVWMDRGRLLPVIDPDGRQATISVGAAIENLVVMARGLGLGVDVLDRRRTDHPDLMARLRLQAGPPPLAAETALVTALDGRHTYRDAFDDRPVPDGLVNRLQLEAAFHGVWMREVAGDLRGVLAVLIQTAESLEQADPRYRDELAAWRRHDPDAADGLPDGVIPLRDARDRGRSLPIRDFTGGVGPQDRAETSTTADPPAAEHDPLVVTLGTVADSPSAWLDTGRAMARVLLVAASHGVMASPLNQAVENGAARATLSRSLGVLGHPQMVLRMGYARPSSWAGRRSIDELVHQQV